MLVAWLLFPLLLAALCLGAGLLVEACTGQRIDGVLLLPLGLMAMIVGVELVTYASWTAPLATPLVIIAPIAGYVLGWSRLRSSAPDPWPIAAAVGVFAVFAAPVVLSGQATFAGYTLLGDTSVHFVLIDRLVEHGHSTAGLIDSSYRDTIDAYLDSAYPFGAQGLLGAVRPLTGQDVAWIYQPYLAMLVTLASLSLYSIAGKAIESRPLRALAAFVAAQPALVYSFSLQGSIKELATLTALATTVALVPIAVRSRDSLRALIPLALASVACLEVLGLASAPWLAPLLVISLAAIIWSARGRHEGKLIARNVAVFAAGVALLALPVLLTAGSFVSNTTDVVTASTEFGNLLGPLRKTQILGVWLQGDYRLPVTGTRETITHLLMWVVAASAIAGLVWAARRRAWLPVMFVVVSLFGSAVAIRRGSPWVDAKALMIGSSCILLAAMVFAGGLMTARWRVVGVLLAVALTGGVLWSNALAYRDAALAPRERLAELDQIGRQLDGKGPTLYNEFDEYGKHFLREGDPTGWSETYGPPDRNGAVATATPLGDIPYDKLERYRTIVLRRSPLADRPPEPYVRTRDGRYYEVWTRPPIPRDRVVAEYPLQAGAQPVAAASCARLRDLSRRGPRLAYAERPAAEIVDLTGAARAAGWAITTDLPPLAVPPPSGRLQQDFSLSRAGRFSVWLTGSVSRPLTVSIDGRRLARIAHQLNQHGVLIELGSAALTGGSHSVELRSDTRGLHPGNDYPSQIGPLVLERTRPAAALHELPSRDWRKLCGRELDWVEVLQAN